MKKIAVISCISAMAALLVAGCGNESVKHHHPSIESLKANGEACISFSECQSNYCNTDNICDDDPVLPKPNGEACTDKLECQSNYCNDNGLCDDMPAQLKPNGQACESGSECVSGYCSDSNLCDDKPVQLKPNGEACESGSECVSGYCNADGNCDNKPAPPVSELDLQEVPEDQNNTTGAECDPDSRQ